MARPGTPKKSKGKGGRTWSTLCRWQLPFFGRGLALTNWLYMPLLLRLGQSIAVIPWQLSLEAVWREASWMSFELAMLKKHRSWRN
jgi:hypothetical protein